MSRPKKSYIDAAIIKCTTYVVIAAPRSSCSAVKLGSVCGEKPGNGAMYRSSLQTTESGVRSSWAGTLMFSGRNLRIYNEDVAPERREHIRLY